ncbi:hypothetical protein D3C80_2061560 [compost metagenome]
MVMGRLHSSADTGGNLIADHHRTQEFFAGRADMLAHRQRGRHRRHAGVINRILEDVIELNSMR